MTTPSESPRPALGELARLATAAMPTPPATSAWFTAQEFIADGYAPDFAKFMAACSPAVILQLVALATGGGADRAIAQPMRAWFDQVAHTSPPAAAFPWMPQDVVAALVADFDARNCRCPSPDARECIEIRYNHVVGAPCDERCECACHALTPERPADAD